MQASVLLEATSQALHGARRNTAFVHFECLERSILLQELGQALEKLLVKTHVILSYVQVCDLRTFS